MSLRKYAGSRASKAEFWPLPLVQRTEHADSLAERYGQIALGDPVAVEEDAELLRGSGLFVWHVDLLLSLPTAAGDGGTVHPLELLSVSDLLSFAAENSRGC